MTAGTVMLAIAYGAAAFALYTFGVAVREAREAFRGVRVVWPWTPR